MEGRISRSFKLIQASWELLGKDPKLLLLPLGSFVVSGLVAWLFVALGLFHGLVAQRLIAYLWLYVFYAITAFIGICFNATLVAVALRRLNGEPATIADGWTLVRAKMPAIVRWALLAASVGLVLRAIEERTGVAGRIVGFVTGMAWALITFFVVPVLLFEPVDVRGAMRRSASIFRQRWGEGLTATVTIAAALVGALLPLMVVGVLLMIVSVPLGVTVMIASFLAVMVFGTALSEVFNAALYRYAVAGTVPSGFAAYDFENVIKRHRRPRWLPGGRKIPPRPDP